jgi:phospholipid/cholesterol/gamma-HCH transport system substrate-binding protein
VPSLDYRVIPSERSDFDVFLSSLPDTVAKASEALNRVNAMLSDRNISSVTAALDNVQTATAELPAAVADGRRLLARLDAAAGEIRAAAANARDVTETAAPEIKLAIVRLREASDAIAAASLRIDGMVAANEENISRFTEQGLGEIEALAADLRVTSRAIERLGRHLDEDPSRLVYQPTSRGVEIPQ